MLRKYISKPFPIFHKTKIAILSDDPKLNDIQESSFYLLEDENALSLLKRNPILYKKSAHYNELFLSLNLESIANIFKNEKRSETISILVIDFKKVNLESLIRIRATFPLLALVLLVEKHQYCIAVDLLKHNTIDSFMPRPPLWESFFTEGASEFQRLQELYFQNACGLKSFLHIFPWWNENFESFFPTFLKENKIQEYFLQNKEGVFCLFDQCGFQHTLYVKNDDQIEADIIELPERVNALENRDQMLCYVPIINQHLDTIYDNFRPFLRKANHIPNSDLYYALI